MYDRCTSFSCGISGVHCLKVNSTRCSSCVYNYCSYCFCTARYSLTLFRCRLLVQESFLGLILLSVFLVFYYDGNGLAVYRKKMIIGELTGPLFLAMPFCFQNLYNQSCCNLWFGPASGGGSNLGRATKSSNSSYLLYH
jgi:hypothetical protein